MCRWEDEFHTDDYYGGNDYDCPADDPNYNGFADRSGFANRSFHTDDYWGGNDYDCPDDVPKGYR